MIRSRSVARTVVAGLLVLTLPAAIGCGGKTDTHGEGDGGPPITVSVVRVGDEAGVAELIVPGRVKAREEVTLSAPRAARLTELPVAEGGRFESGQPLARFDAPEMRRALEAARASLAAARLRREQAALQEARMDSLFASGAASRREHELAQSELRAAEADEAAAEAQHASWIAATSIPAPFPGVVVRHRVDVGANVNPGDPLLDIRSTGASEIQAPVPESGIHRIGGATAWVQVGDGPWIEARVARLDGMTDFATRTRMAHLRVIGGERLDPGAYARVRFSAPDSAGPTRPAESAIRPGLAAPAREAGATPAVAAAVPLRVPQTSVVRRGALTGVYVIRDGRAELRWLRLGRPAGGSVEVLAGLWPGEEVAVDPAGLTHGRAVSVER